MKRRQWTTNEDAALLGGYRGDVDIEILAKQLKVGRSAIYRRLSVLDEPARDPRKRRLSGYHVNILPYVEAHRLVAEVLKAASLEYFNMSTLAQRTGVTREALHAINRGGGVKLKTLEAMGAAVGKRLVWVDWKP